MASWTNIVLPTFTRTGLDVAGDYYKDLLLNMAIVSTSLKWISHFSFCSKEYKKDDDNKDERSRNISEWS